MSSQNFAEVANAPSVYLPSGYTNDIPYIGIQVDGAINALHWIQPNLVAKADGNMTIDASVQGASKVECPYLEPEPPADPHDYVILLYKQPNNWTVPEQYAKINPPSNIPDRLNFSLPDFMASSGLGAPIAATYFRAMNGTAQQSSYAVTATTYGVVVPATDTPVTASASRTNSAPVATFTGGAASAAVSMVELAAVAAVGWLGFL